MLKASLLMLSCLNILGCDGAPKPPVLWQCGYSIKFSKFRCVNTETKETLNLSRDDMKMEGAQCLSLDDYKKSEKYISELITYAREKCK
jgi:hypothetical protein